MTNQLDAAFRHMGTERHPSVLDTRLSEVIVTSGFGSIRAKVSKAVAQRRYDEALAVAALLVAEHPGEPEAHMALSESFSHLARYEEAIQAVTRAIALDADRVGSIAHRGRLHLKAEQFDAARADFEQAIGTGERVGISYFRSDALLHLAIALEQLGRREDAFVHLESLDAEQSTWYRGLQTVAAMRTRLAKGGDRGGRDGRGGR